MPWPYALVAEHEPDPNGVVAFAGSDPSNPGTIWISTLDGAGVNHGVEYATLVEGDTVRLSDIDDPALWQEHLCRTTPTIADGVLTIVDPVHMADGTPGRVLDVPSPVVVTVRPAKPLTQYEIVEVRVALGDRVEGTPEALPPGWVPLQAERRSGTVVVLMTRQIGATATTLSAGA
jgi:hypothetical protein